MSDALTKHFVTFYSPGNVVAEESTRPIDRWDVHAAVAMAREVKERHGATPYGFRFTTRSRGPEDLDSMVSDRSVFYYLGGEIRTVEEVEAERDPKDRILLSNMKANRCNRVIVNRNSWAWTQPLHDDDVVLEFTP